MADQNSANIDRLSKLLGYDAAKQHGGKSVFDEALKEIQEEKDKATKVKAKEMLQKAIDIRMKMDEIDKQYNANRNKFNKELGKLMGKIEAFSRGESPAAIEAKEQEAKEAEAETVES